MIPTIRDIARDLPQGAFKRSLLKLARFEDQVEESIRRSKVIIDLLKTGPCNRKELREASGFTADEVRKILNGLNVRSVDNSALPRYELIIKD